MDNVIDRIFADCKGILAADESSPTIKKRLESVGKESTIETRHSYRHNLFSTEGLSKYIGGVILFEETLKSPETLGPLKDQGIVLGIKVDQGTSPYGDEGGRLLRVQFVISGRSKIRLTQVHGGQSLPNGER